MSSNYTAMMLSDSPRVTIKHGIPQREHFRTHAYHCLPLTEANKFGYDLSVEEDIDVEWFGGQEPRDVRCHYTESSMRSLWYTHFGQGTFTVDTGLLWKVPEDHDLMLLPVPNSDYADQFQVLAALVESDWLNYPFFLTIRLMQPGRIVIKAQTPLARVIAFKRLDSKELPTIIPQNEIPSEIETERLEWEKAREEAMRREIGNQDHFLYKKNMQRRIKQSKK